MENRNSFLRGAAVFALILELEVALFGTYAGRVCASSFSWTSALYGLALFFIPGFIFTVLIPLALSIWATRLSAWPDVEDSGVRFWFAVCAIALPILVVVIVLLAVPANPDCHTAWV